MPTKMIEPAQALAVFKLLVDGLVKSKVTRAERSDGLKGELRVLREVERSGAEYSSRLYHRLSQIRMVRTILARLFHERARSL